MSDAKAEIKGSVPSGVDGRTLSRSRRQAMSRGGKAGVGLPSKDKPGARPATMARVESAPASLTNSSAGSSAVSGNDCGCIHAAEQPTLDAVCSIIEADPSSPSSVRQLCQERRRELSNQGKPAKSTSSARQSGPRRNGNKARAGNGLSGRAAAQARREELCVNGRGDSPACRPTGRVRTTAAAPAKVEEGSTLRGTLVTGTQVERSGKVTGIETGSCRAITGTEYIGTEQYAQLCTTIPSSAPAKVSTSSTSRGQRVSGTDVGLSVQVTGEEHGACKSITGTEYISSEQFESFCSTKPTPGPAKVGVSATRAGQLVSGTEVGRSTKVTGDEPGACLKLTGIQYSQSNMSGSVCQGTGVPHKVSVMSTAREHPVTGTNVAAGAVVTGSEYGACSNVTGTEYAGLEQYQGCNREPILTPEKTKVLRTWHDQALSGMTVEHNPKVTGDEYGGCQPISGTEYIGPGQYAEFCMADDVAASRERVATRHGAAGASMTGVRQSAENKVTGKARGEAQRLSGTPYSDGVQHSLSGAVGMSQHHLARGPVDRNKLTVGSAAAPVQSNFSIVSPARSAQASQLSRVTNASFSTQGRITGPVNLATGLVSGTPEFRYRDDNTAALPAAKEPAPVIEPVSRVTGEGREAGFTITGAVWQRGRSTTGTEGTSARRRNPTLRGDQRSMVAMQVPAMKDREHLQVPPSKVTGSSGNAATGSTITYSGGARG